MKDSITQILVSQGVAERGINDQAHLAYDLGLDSLDITELMMMLEQEFGIRIPDTDQIRLQRVGDIRAYIEEKLDSQAESKMSFV